MTRCPPQRRIVSQTDNHQHLAGAITAGSPTLPEVLSPIGELVTSRRSRAQATRIAADELTADLDLMIGGEHLPDLLDGKIPRGAGRGEWMLRCGAVGSHVHQLECRNVHQLECWVSISCGHHR